MGKSEKLRCNTQSCLLTISPTPSTKVETSIIVKFKLFMHHVAYIVFFDRQLEYIPVNSHCEYSCNTG